MDKDTQTTIIGILTAVATLAQVLLQFFGALGAATTGATIPLTVAAGIAALGVKSKGA